MKPTHSCSLIKIVVLFAVLASFPGLKVYGEPVSMDGTNIRVLDDQLILNVGTAAAALSIAAQNIASASHSQLHISQLNIDASLHGVVNVGAGLASYAKATQEIGVADSRYLTQDVLSLDLKRRVTNAAASLAASARASQKIGVFSGQTTQKSKIDISSGGPLTNVGAALAARARATQIIGETEVNGETGMAYENTLDLTLDKGAVNAGIGILGAGTATQTIGRLEGSAAIDNLITLDAKGRINNTGSGILGAGTADQEIGEIDGTGLVFGNTLDLTLGKEVENAGSGILGAGKAIQEIGLIKGNVTENAVTVNAKGRIANVASGDLGLGRSTQIIGGIDTSAEKAIKNEISIQVDSITAAGRGIAGSGSVQQRIGVLSGGGHDNAIAVTTGDITGAGRGLAGSGHVEQTVGTLSGGGQDNSITITTGDITGSGAGIMGQGKSIENIGRIDTETASNIRLNITTGNISTSAVGLNSTAEIDIGWIQGTPSGGVDSVIKVGKIDNKLLGANSFVAVKVGDVSGKIDGVTKIRITTGDLSAEVAADFNSRDNDLGIWIGNVKGPVHGNANVNVKAGDIHHTSVYAAGCVGSACLSDVVGYSKIKVGNVGMGEDEYVGNYAQQFEDCIKNPTKNCLKYIASDMDSAADAICDNLSLCKEARKEWNACPFCPGKFDPVYWLKKIYL